MPGPGSSPKKNSHTRNPNNNGGNNNGNHQTQGFFIRIGSRTGTGTNNVILTRNTNGNMQITPTDEATPRMPLGDNPQTWTFGGSN